MLENLCVGPDIRSESENTISTAETIGERWNREVERSCSYCLKERSMMKGMTLERKNDSKDTRMLKYP